MTAMTSTTTANAAQRDAWNGATGAFWAEHADQFDRGVAAYTPALLRAAALAPGHRVLDVGCGTGVITRTAARTVTAAGHAHGVDLSTRMLDLARQRADDEHLTNVSFTRADAQVHRFETTVDVIVSRHGAMFFDDPVAAFANLAGALRPGGRIVLLVWQAFERNPFLHRILDALTPGRDTPQPPADGRPSPLSFADPDRAKAVLTAAGFSAVHVRPEEEAMDFGPDPSAAFDYLTKQHAGLIAQLEPAARTEAFTRLRADLDQHHQAGQGVRYPSACWLITAVTAVTASVGSRHDRDAAGS
jgi:SAM-dependent methyltransferase